MKVGDGSRKKLNGVIAVSLDSLRPQQAFKARFDLFCTLSTAQRR